MTYPRPPFNNPAADTIIRSSDGIDYRVRSGIVAEASPIFSDMFEIPLPDHSGVVDSQDFMDGKPVVAVQEDSVTLDRLLRLCYPTVDPILPELQDVRTVLAAALKYEMEESVALMKEALLGFVDTQPLAVWATACELRLEAEAKIAARVLVGADIPIDAPPELQNVTAGAYYRLVKFHRAGGVVGEGFKFCEPDPEDVPEPKSALSRIKSFTYQPRPFADIVCRSADGQDYQTHKIILSTASPLLRDRIHALAAHSSSSELPVLLLDIPGNPLGMLLEICYPVEHDLGALPIHDTLVAISCARRLDMKVPFTLLMDSATVSSAEMTAPLATYLLASRLGLSELVKEVLDFLCMDPYTYGCIPEMEFSPALPYHRLLVTRRASTAIVSEITSTLGKSRITTTRGTSDRAANAGCSGSGAAAGMPIGGDPWLRKILERTAEELRSPKQDDHQCLPDMHKTLQESLDRKVWCGTCEGNLRIVFQIDKLQADVSQALYDNNAKLGALHI
ncbi:hypothetical protein OH76DRAFT_1398543 [Lentinus brumalis]|uniref:BTB domain-containing protein n=1 Tax=Lentinus brumalis TaxID=2498619 RepID=A0A371DNU4_9APHY|nr:hypothetical protein OH76DRAFT_1398543 [Polyporus brumalis]